MKCTFVTGGRIEEVWFRAMVACLRQGRRYLIDKGEFAGTHRLELEFAQLNVVTPGIRPLASKLGRLVPTSDGGIESYFWGYLMDPNFDSAAEAKNNVYKYATWIAPAWEHCCELLSKGEGGCNQATISLGPPPGEVYEQPPCLRVIDMQVSNGKLNFVVYFRSWDLVNGLPVNLGGLQRLKEICLETINLNRALDGRTRLRDGAILGISKGLHIYESYLSMVEEQFPSVRDAPLTELGIHVLGEH